MHLFGLALTQALSTLNKLMITAITRHWLFNCDFCTNVKVTSYTAGVSVRCTAVHKVYDVLGPGSPCYRGECYTFGSMRQGKARLKRNARAASIINTHAHGHGQGCYVPCPVARRTFSLR